MIICIPFLGDFFNIGGPETKQVLSDNLALKSKFL